MPRGKPLPEGWKHTYCTLIAEGYTRSDAAKTVGVSLGTINRRQSDDEEFRDLYQAAREHVRDEIRNRIWQIGMEPLITTKEGTAEVADTQSMRWALDHLIKWNLPEAADTQRVELAGTVQIAHEARLTLANLLQASRHVEGLSVSPQRELPAAQILAEPDEDIAAAGDLPVRPAA